MNKKLNADTPDDPNKRKLVFLSIAGVMAAPVVMGGGYLAGSIMADHKRDELVQPMTDGLTKAFKEGDIKTAAAILQQAKKIYRLPDLVINLEVRHGLEGAFAPPDDIDNASLRSSGGKFFARNLRETVQRRKSRDAVQLLSQARTEGALNATVEELSALYPQSGMTR